MYSDCKLRILTYHLFLITIRNELETSYIINTSIKKISVRLLYKQNMLQTSVQTEHASDKSLMKTFICLHIKPYHKKLKYPLDGTKSKGFKKLEKKRI
jgi:hypothetical protein